MKQTNPFALETKVQPLKLALDPRSWPTHGKGTANVVTFFEELCETEAVEPTWAWGDVPPTGDFPRLELRDVQHDERRIGYVGEEPYFINVIRMWGSFERMADKRAGDERDWFLHYAPLTKFVAQSDFHYLVTNDSELLNQVAGSRGYFRRDRRLPILSVAQAVRICGLAMMARDRVFHNATTRTNTYTVNFYLGPELVPSRVRLSEWSRQFDSDESDEEFFHGSEQSAIAQSVLDRVCDLLFSRRYIALEQLKSQNNATVDSCLYHLRAAIGSAAATIDALAVLSQLAFLPPTTAVDGGLRLSLRRRQFRKTLRESGGVRTADVASQSGVLLGLIWDLRNPVLHRESISGFTLGRGAVSRASQESRVALNDNQAGRLVEYMREQGSAEDDWGFERRGGWTASVDAYRFGDRFVIASIATAEALMKALADDLELAEDSTVWPGDHADLVRRFRWLDGL